MSDPRRLRDSEPGRRGRARRSICKDRSSSIPIRRLGRQLVLTSSRYPVRYPVETVRLRPGTNPAAWAVTAASDGVTRSCSSSMSRIGNIPSPAPSRSNCAQAR